MVFRLHAHHPLVKVFNSTLVSLPSPSTLSILWNFGSLLGLSLVVQILTGVFLAMHYIPDMELAFSSVIYTSQDVHYGWLLRALHSNGASFFFICLFIHIGRGIYYGSYVFFHTWMVGVVICFLVMGTAFMGYVLPWGQMSFWGATVITNLLSVVPYIGLDLVQWVWGGFSVSNATLTRFFTFHFLMPFAVAAMSGVHLVFLHMSGSSNQLGLPLNADKIMFYPYYGWKDLTGVLIYIYLLLGVSLLAPYMLGDTDNFILANPMVTPTHIQPEWYFLFAYAILRSIPNKLGGVVALVVSIAILFILPFTNLSTFKGKTFFPFSSFLFWSLVASVVILSWIGMCPVEPPYIFVGQLFTVIYFSLYLMIPLSEKVWCDLLLKSKSKISLVSKTSILYKLLLASSSTFRWIYFVTTSF